MSQYPARIRYEYENDPAIRLEYAHGVWGGISPQGEIEINFYMESDKMPKFSERLAGPDGAFGHEMAPFDDDERVITRHIRAKVLVNYHTACALRDWLEDKIEALEMEEPLFGQAEE